MLRTFFLPNMGSSIIGFLPFRSDQGPMNRDITMLKPQRFIRHFIIDRGNSSSARAPVRLKVSLGQMYRVYCMFTIHLYTVQYISFASKQNSLRLEQECLTLRFIQAGINNEILICFRVAWKATFFAKFGLHFFKWQAKGRTANTLFWIGSDFWDKERKSIFFKLSAQKSSVTYPRRFDSVPDPF